MAKVMALLLALQLAGEILARATAIAVPGPVFGMLGLFLLLIGRERMGASLPAAWRDGTLETVAQGLLKHLSLLFVPAGVGVIQRLDVLGRDGAALILALVVSSLAGLVVTAAVFHLLARSGGEHE